MRRAGHAVKAVALGLDLHDVLRTLADKGVTRLMVEGGARVAASLIEAGLVDEVWLLRGPNPVGAGGVAALGALPLTAITQSPALRIRASETLENDTLRFTSESKCSPDHHRRWRVATLTPVALGQLLRLRDSVRYVRRPTPTAPRDRLQRRLPHRGRVGVESGRTWFDVDAAAETSADHARHWQACIPAQPDLALKIGDELAPHVAGHADASPRRPRDDLPTWRCFNCAASANWAASSPPRDR